MLVPPEDINVNADTVLCRSCESAFQYSELSEASAARGASFETRPGGFRAVATTRNGWVWLLIPSLGVWIAVGWRVLSFLRAIKGFSDASILFLAIPFTLGLLLHCAYILMLGWGRVEVRRDGDEGTVFQGAGQFGWTRRFKWSELRSIEEAAGLLRPRAGPPPKLIELDFNGGRSLRFGTLLTQERRWFLISRLRSQTNGWPRMDTDEH